VSARRYRYTGKERDEETGLYYYGARYYAAWLGRWTSADPLGLQAGVNLYLYCRAGPVTYVDPDGMQDQCAQPDAIERKLAAAPDVDSVGQSVPEQTVSEPDWFDDSKPDDLLTGSSGPVNDAPAGPPTGDLTPLHQEIREAATTYTPSAMVFGYSDVVKWKTDPDYLLSFKAQFVFENREIERAAAESFDIPPELVAGVVFNEIGGKDPIKDSVYWARTWLPGTEDRDKTSLGQQATQVRRAAESLGYNPSTISETQRSAIVESLRDPSESIFIAAKHLSDLRDVDFPGTPGASLSEDQIQVIGARYNQGPTRALQDVKKDLSYGQAITARWKLLGGLLSTPPRQLDYAPIQNGFVKPTLLPIQNQILRLYGVP